MYSTIRLDNLDRCIANNENDTLFDLSDYIGRSACGTTACLVGNDFIACQTSNAWRNDVHVRLDVFAFGGREYQLPNSLYDFLFMPWHRALVFDSDCGVSFVQERRRNCFDKDAALNRLRKAVAYWKRKQSIWHEADGRIRESARRTEGDLNILRDVLAEVSEPSLAAAV